MIMFSEMVFKGNVAVQETIRISYNAIATFQNVPQVISKSSPEAFQNDPETRETFQKRFKCL